MKTMQIREAKAKLSEVVKSAEAGETTTITRHGLPVAKVVPFADDRPQLPKPGQAKSFAELLLSFPGGDDIDFDEIRDQFPVKDVDHEL